MEKEEKQTLQQHSEDECGGEREKSASTVGRQLRLQSWQGRALWLRLRSRLWILPLLAIIGALVGGGIYFLVTCVFADAREYQEVSKLYIDFAYDETGTVYDYYNGATWTDLLTAEPRLSEAIEEAIPDISLEEVKASVKAEILSDIRLMTVTVTNADREKTERMAQAVNQALQSFGEQAKEFEKITFLSAEGPSLELISDRTRNAVLLGGVIGLLLAAVLLWIRVLTGDGIYAPEEVTERFDLPVLGVLTKDEPQKAGRKKAEAQEQTEEKAQEKVPEAQEKAEEQEKTETKGKKPRTPRLNPWTQEVLAANLQGTGVAGGQVLLVSPVKDREMLQKAADAVEKALVMCAAKGATVKADAEAADLALCQKADHVLLVMPWGKDCGVRTTWLLQQLNTQGIVPAGVLLMQASGRFLQEYYRIREDEKA